MINNNDALMLLLGMPAEKGSPDIRLEFPPLCGNSDIGKSKGNCSQGKKYIKTKEGKGIINILVIRICNEPIITVSAR